MRELPGRRTLALLGGTLLIGLLLATLLVRGATLPWLLAIGLALVVALLLWREARLRVANAELRRRMLEVQEANAAKSRFLANMSHELRTPLNGIMGFAELLHDGHLGRVSEEQAEGLADILTSSRHLLALVNDILDLSRVEAGRLQLHPELVDPRKLACECVDSLRSLADAADLQVSLRTPSEMAAVLLDPGKLRQVILNFLSNAIKFTPAGGRVLVVVERIGDWLRVEVSDTGPGIAPRDHERVFFEFEQVSGAARRDGGTGLGLAVTKRIVEAQQGCVGLSSALGEGSTFYAQLPLTTAAAATPPRVELRRVAEGLVPRVSEAAA